ncbi:MAG: ABC transporter substrate-binding protein [Proteobacteria bacterium]|nr:ABC transporter substrate-binding protein [Pseudomonadota bacterium]
MKYAKTAIILITVLMLLSFPLPSDQAAAKDRLKFGAAIQLSGAVAAPTEELQIRDWKLWVEQVNGRGGIFVPEHGKRLPVDLILYDDRSDPGTTVRMVEKLILEDKVDVILPPWGTAWHFAVAPLVNKYKYPMIGTSCASATLKMMAPNLPYFFVMEIYTARMAESLVELLQELGVKSAAVIFVSTLYGIDWWEASKPLLKKAGIDVVLLESYPLEVTDLSPLLKKIKSLNPDALLGYAYPGDSHLITEQSKVIDFNPKFFTVLVGAASPVFRDKFGADVVEGITGCGVWNPKVPYPGAREYFDAYVAKWGVEPDRWETYNYAALQIWEQVISKVGLDREKQRQMIASDTFPTMWGNIKFVDQYNIDSPGDIGQWQNGEFEAVAPRAKRLAAGVERVVYPKPPWPK